MAANVTNQIEQKNEIENAVTKDEIIANENIEQMAIESRASKNPNSKAKATTAKPKPNKTTKPKAKPKPPPKTTTKKPAIKNKVKTSEKSKPRAKGTLYGLSTLRRSGDVAVSIMSNHTTIKSNFAVGPLILRVEKEVCYNKLWRDFNISLYCE